MRKKSSIFLRTPHIVKVTHAYSMIKALFSLYLHILEPPKGNIIVEYNLDKSELDHIRNMTILFPVGTATLDA